MTALKYSFLKVSGERVVDGEGKDIILRGAGLGGWMKWVFVLQHQLGFNC